METLEVYISHITGRCPDCKTDENNKECPDYKPVTLHTFKVVDYTHKPIITYPNPNLPPQQ